MSSGVIIIYHFKERFFFYAGVIMAKKTVSVNARIDPDLKQDAEAILDKLGLTSSNIIAMLYNQIVLHRGIPFEIKLPELSAHILSEDQFNEELEKGLADVDNGNTVPTVKVFTSVK